VTFKVTFEKALYDLDAEIGLLVSSCINDPQ
jgi:hypothetical protein